MTTAELEALMKTCIRRLDRPKYVPHVLDERAHAIKCEENRCAEVDAYYKSIGVQRTPEAVLARRVYRDEAPKKFKSSRNSAYN
jgi:hypothetical protein